MPPKRGLTPNRKNQVRQQQHAQQQQQTAAPAPAPAPTPAPTPANITQQPQTPAQKDTNNNDTEARWKELEKSIQEQTKEARKNRITWTIFFALTILIQIFDYYEKKVVNASLLEFNATLTRLEQQGININMLPALLSQELERRGKQESSTPIFRVDETTASLFYRVLSFLEIGTTAIDRGSEALSFASHLVFPSLVGITAILLLKKAADKIMNHRTSAEFKEKEKNIMEKEKSVFEREKNVVEKEGKLNEREARLNERERNVSQREEHVKVEEEIMKRNVLEYFQDLRRSFSRSVPPEHQQQFERQAQQVADRFIQENPPEREEQRQAPPPPATAQPQQQQQQAPPPQQQSSASMALARSRAFLQSFTKSNE